MYMAKA